MKRRKITFMIGLFLCLFSISMISQNRSHDVTQYLQKSIEDSKLRVSDASFVITDEYTSSISEITHIYFRQTLDGVEIFGTESDIHLTPNGKIVLAHNRFIGNANERIVGTSTPSLSVISAVQSVANQLGYTLTKNLTVSNKESTLNSRFLVSDGGISLSPIPVKLLFQRLEDDTLQLVWQLSIQEITQQHWWNVRVDANSGEIISKNDYMVTCDFNHSHDENETALDYNKNLVDIPNHYNAESIACTECYEVIALPLESPLYGTRTIENTPAYLPASPFGWHDTNGAAGAEYTTTRGNNVNAYEDGDNPGYQPDGGATLDFSGFPFSAIYTNTNQYEDAAITNLFYWNNVTHDILHTYGFNEAGGNFQVNNYGNGGNGNDSVNAEAQDGSGSCNANFGTPPDGSSPTMQMYTCSDRDGDFDNLVIVHEYAHGISNRLTGGPNNTSCLFNEEQMGEGWSDFYGVILTIQPGDIGTDGRGVGTFLFGQGAGGSGIRSYPYSTDMTIDPQTYDYIKTEVVPHGVGSVWATMLWEMTWALIDAHGFDANIYNFTGDENQDAGNIMALALVTEAMKLQPCNPGFVDGRDAILAADLAIYNGANECIIWDAFAKRGLGISADQGSSSSRSDGTEAFDTPSGIAAFTAPSDVCENEPIMTGLGGGTPSGGTYSGTGVTDDGNGSTYSFDPSVAGVGIHTITYDVPAGSCSTASTASDTIEVLAIPASPTTVGVADFCPNTPVTVTATLNDPTNVIRWFDAATEGNFLFEGSAYTFSPSGTTTVYAQENPPGVVSQLVISEITLETPDRLEIQNVGEAFDYSGYVVAISEQPFTDINTINPITQTLGAMGTNSVVDFNDNGGAGYWGNNIWWGESGGGWIIVLDPSGNVVDSVFWNYSAAEIATLNVTINGFVITAASLDWTGNGASFNIVCNSSFRRHGDTNTMTDWSLGCEVADYGIANADIGLGFVGCLGDRTPTDVLAETVAPVITCPSDVTVQVNQGEQYTLPDYTTTASATDNCTASPAITQDPIIGTQVGVGDTVITLTATDEAGNTATCTFTLTVDELLGIENPQFASHIILYPNPTTGNLVLKNGTTEQLLVATFLDVNGRIIKSFNLKDAGFETSISINDLASGLYFVRIETQNFNMIKRIVKQ